MRSYFVMGLVGGLLVATLLFFYGFVALRPAHLAALVPEDFSFGVFSSSLNDLHQLYEAPLRNREADPRVLRFGIPANVPGLDGYDYDEPLASFLDGEGREVILIPVENVDAFEEKFDQERERIAVREPERVARNYLALSTQPIDISRASRSNPLALAASAYPLALAGHPKDGLTLRLMLTYLFLRESPRKPPGVPILGPEVGHIPRPVAERIAAECDSLLLGFPLPTDPGAVEVEGRADLSSGSLLARSAHLTTETDLANLAASFPFDTVLLLGLVLDGDGWRELGLPLPVGDAAVAFGLVEKPIHARPYTLLVAARPAAPADLARLEATGAHDLLGGAALAWTTQPEGAATVRTAPLDAWPDWIAPVLRSHAQTPPPVFVSTASERGIWYCAIGSQAESAVRHALGCLRDRPELGLQRARQVAAHPEFLARPHVGLAMVTAAGMKAFDYRMPMVEIASLGQPPAVTAVLDVDGAAARLDMRIER